MAAGQILMEKLLDTVVNQRASDLIISVGQPPVIKKGGRIRRLDTKNLDNDDTTGLMKSITPERIQGRMNAVMRFIVWGTIPLGSLIGGALGTWIGLRTALIIGGIGCTLPFLPVLLSPVRAIREMPSPVDEVPEPEPLLADVAAVTVQQQPGV